MAGEPIVEIHLPAGIGFEWETDHRPAFPFSSAWQLVWDPYNPGAPLMVGVKTVRDDDPGQWSIFMAKHPAMAGLMTVEAARECVRHFIDHTGPFTPTEAEQAILDGTDDDT